MLKYVLYYFLYGYIIKYLTQKTHTFYVFHMTVHIMWSCKKFEDVFQHLKPWTHENNLWHDDENLCSHNKIILKNYSKNAIYKGLFQLNKYLIYLATWIFFFIQHDFGQQTQRSIDHFQCWHLFVWCKQHNYKKTNVAMATLTFLEKCFVFMRVVLGCFCLLVVNTEPVNWSQVLLWMSYAVAALH